MELMEAVQFCFSEADRFHKTNIADVPFHDRVDFLAKLNDRTGEVSVVVGRIARKRLYDWCNDFLKRRSWTHLADSSECTIWLQEEIAHRFFGKGTNANMASISRLIDRFEKFVKQGVREHRYLWPCHICFEDKPSVLSIGPVRFRPMNEAGDDIDLGLASWGEQEDKGAFVEERIRGYYGEFRWLADVSVNTADAVVAKRISLNAVRVALAILKLFYGGGAESRIRVSHQQNYKLDRAEIYFTDEPHLSWSSSVAEEPFPETWWEDINQGENAWRLRVLGRVVDGICDPSELNFLKRKLLNALIWFDDATTDTHPGARVSKYVNAMESIAGCGEREGLTELVSDRVSCMLANWPEEDEFDEILKRVREVYRVRSELVHGERDPLGIDLTETVHSAGHLAHMTIVAYTDFALTVGIDRDDYDNAKQAEAFKIMRQSLSRLDGQ